jgi:hypothetical protein
MRVETPSPGSGFAARFAFGSGTGAGSLAPIAGGAPEADAPGAGPAVAGTGSAGSGGAGSGGAGRSEHPAARATAAGYPEVTLVAVVFSAATIVFGVFPSPMFNLVAHAGRALGLH